MKKKIKDLTMEEQISLVVEHPRDIAKLVNPSEALQALVVELDRLAVRYIKTPSPEMQRVAVQEMNTNTISDPKMILKITDTAALAVLAPSIERWIEYAVCFAKELEKLLAKDQKGRRNGRRTEKIEQLKLQLDGLVGVAAGKELVSIECVPDKAAVIVTVAGVSYDPIRETDELLGAFKLLRAALEYISLQERRSHPDGSFDKAGRFYLDRTYDCCSAIHPPTGSFPYPYMVHGRTIKHVSYEYGLDTSALRRIVRKLQKAQKAQEEAQEDFAEKGLKTETETKKKDHLPAKDVRDLTLDEQLAMVVARPEDIGKCTDPPEALQLAAVKLDHYAIEHIKNPSEAVKLAAVGRNGYAIKRIKSPSEAVKLAAVSQNGYVIQDIINPTEEIKLAAVKNRGYAIQDIINPTEEIKLAAVKNRGDAIKCIKNPSEAVKLAAVSQNGYVIKDIKNPSEEIKLAAVNNCGDAIKYIKNPSEEVKLAAVKENGLAIEYIGSPSAAVQRAAVRSGLYDAKMIDLRKITDPQAVAQLDKSQQETRLLHFAEDLRYSYKKECQSTRRNPRRVAKIKRTEAALRAIIRVWGKTRDASIVFNRNDYDRAVVVTLDKYVYEYPR